MLVKKNDLVKSLTDAQTRTFSAQIDGVEIYKSRYTSAGIKILSESTIDPEGHQLLTFHINDNPVPVHSISLEANKHSASQLAVSKADFF